MLNKIIDGKNLSFEEAYELFDQLLNESEIRIAAYLAAIQTKGYTAEEIAGLAKAMRDKAIKIDLGSVADTCGTGGDGSATINVSTAVAFILSCFTRVAKHGNVSVTSKSGSANVLEAFGVNINMDPEDARKLIDETNFTFLFAPRYHPALKKIMPVRKQLGIKTVFNVLGPLANPAEPDYQIVGVNSPDLVEKIAEALKLLGVEKALVVHGSGLDEISPSNETIIAEIGKDVEIYNVTPEDFGVEKSKIQPCSSPDESAERIMKVFSGEINDDANFILINASAALYAAKIASDFKDGVELAKNAIENGEVLKKLQEVRNACKKA